MAQELRHYECDAKKFVNLKTRLMPLWDKTLTIWESVEEKLPLQKYRHSDHSEHREVKLVTCLATNAGQRKPTWFGLTMDLMPWPVTYLLFPMFRYVP